MRINIKRKLIGMYLMALLTTISLWAFGYSVLDRQTDALNEISRMNSRLLAVAKQIETIMFQHRMYEKDFFLNISKPEKQNQFLEKYMAKSVTLKKLIEQFGSLADRTENAYLAKEIRNKIPLLFENCILYHRGFYKVADKVRSDASITPQKANTLMRPYETTFDELESGIKHVVSTVTKSIDLTETDVYKKEKDARITLFLLSAGCIFLIAILSFISSMNILKPLKNANSVFGVSEHMNSSMPSGVAASEQASTNRGLVASTAEEINAKKQVS